MNNIDEQIFVELMSILAEVSICETNSTLPFATASRNCLFFSSELWFKRYLIIFILIFNLNEVKTSAGNFLFSFLFTWQVRIFYITYRKYKFSFFFSVRIKMISISFLRISSESIYELKSHIDKLSQLVLKSHPKKLRSLIYHTNEV